jgi:hypothetical protein
MMNKIIKNKITKAIIAFMSIANINHTRLCSLSKPMHETQSTLSCEPPIDRRPSIEPSEQVPMSPQKGTFAILPYPVVSQILDMTGNRQARIISEEQPIVPIIKMLSVTCLPNSYGTSYIFRLLLTDEAASRTLEKFGPYFSQDLRRETVDENTREWAKIFLTSLFKQLHRDNHITSTQLGDMIKTLSNKRLDFNLRPSLNQFTITYYKPSIFGSTFKEVRFNYVDDVHIQLSYPLKSPTIMRLKRCFACR